MTALRLFLAAALLALGLAAPAQAQTEDLASEDSWARLLRYAVTQLNAPGEFEIELGRITTLEDGATAIARIALSDGVGVWLEAEGVEVLFDSAAALTGVARFERITATRIRLNRAPVLRGDPPSTDDPEAGLALTWPRAPANLAIERLEADEIDLAASVLGERVRGRLAAGLADQGDVQTARARLERIDGAPLILSFASERRFDGAGFVRIAVDAEEGANGLIARRIGADGADGLTLTIRAEGDAERLPFEARAAAEDALTLTLAGAARWAEGGLAIEATGRAEAGARSPATVRAALGAGATLRIAATGLGAPATEIAAFDFESPALAVSAQGRIDQDADAIAITGSLRAPEPNALAGVVGLMRLGALDGRLDASGRLSAPTLALALRVSEAAGAFGAAETLSVTLNGAPEGARAAGALEIAASGLALSDENLAALIGAAPRIEARGVWDGAAEAATLERLTARLARASLDGEGRFDVAAMSLDARFEAALEEAEPLFALLGVEGEGRGALSLELEGLAPERLGRLVARGALTDLAFADPAVARLVGQRVRLDLDMLGADGAARIARGAVTLAAAELTLSGEVGLGRIGSADDRLAIDLDAALRDPAALAPLIAPAALKGGAARISARGRRTAPTVVATADLTAPRVGEAVTADRARIEARAELRRDERAPFSVEARLEGARHGSALLGAVLGPSPALAARGLFDRATRRLALDALELATERLSAALSGDVDFAAGRLDLAYRAQLSDLGGAARVSGGLFAEGRLAGPLGAPAATAALNSDRLSVGATRLDGLSATLDLAGGAGAPRGSLDLDARLDGAPLRLRMTAETLDERLIAELAELRWRGVAARGRVAAPLRGGPLDGRLTLTAPDLTTLAPVVGPIAGAARAELTLSARDGRQSLALAAALERFRAPGVRVSALNADLAGALDDVALTLRGEGVALGEIRGGRLSGAARIRARGETMAIAVDDLAFESDAARLALTAPARLTRRGERTVLERLAAEIRVGDAPPGRLNAEAADDPRGLSASVEARALPLTLLRVIGAAPISGGSLSGEARLAPTQGSARLRLEGGLIGDQPPETAAHGAASLDWDGRRIRLSAAITPGGDAAAPEPLRLEATLPAAPRDGRPALLDTAPLSARLTWDGPAEALWTLAPLVGHDLRGPLTIDLSVGGSAAAPRFEGGARLAKGAYSFVDAGAALRDVDLTVETDGARIDLDLAAAAGDGRLTAKGAITPARGEAMIDIAAERARLIARDDLNAVASGVIAMRLGGAAPSIKGAVTLDSLEFRLIGGGATTPPLIDYVAEGESAPLDQSAALAPPKPAAPIALDLKIDATRRLFVRGRGLDSEWAGALTVRGTVDDPEVVGAVKSRRGGFSLAGAPFTLAPSEVVFSGPLDPIIDVTLTRENAGVEGGLAATGRASAPTIAFFSEPSLPEDEVLPYLVFGRSAAELSGVEAAQLAAGLATLAGGRAGPLDAARSALGLDTLGVGTDEAGAPSLSAGRYVADGVYLELREGATSEDRSVAVEIDVAPEVKVEGEFGSDGSAAGGLRWERDY